jgi:hypothetical protein
VARRQAQRKYLVGFRLGHSTRSEMSLCGGSPVDESVGELYPHDQNAPLELTRRSPRH